MKQKIVLETNYQETFRTSKVAGLFDLQSQKKIQREWNVDLPIDEFDWKIGLIVGSSGSGKTTIIKKLFPNDYHSKFTWGNQSILEYFPKELTINEIINALSHIGFSSPPNWLLPYDALSNGQKFRVNIARALLENKKTIIIDEFTSFVDRTVAKISSAAISKFLKKSNKKFIAVSCHNDIIEWLEPDWIYNTDQNKFEMVHLRRPEITLQIFKCEKSLQQSIWQIFKQHHYLTNNLSNQAIAFYALIDNNFCGFTSYITMPLKNKKKMYREHRTVVLPDYQGIGIGNKLSEFLAEYILINFDEYMYTTTSHPSIIFSRNKNSKWQMLKKPSIKSPHTNQNYRKTGSHNRLTASFKFIN